MKKLLLTAMLLSATAAAAFAIDITALKPQGYVSDYAGVVDAASRQQLEQYCASLERATGVQFAIVTIPTLDGEPVDQVANDLFRKWGIGHKGKDDGILLLLSIQDRRSRLEVGYGLEPAITDGLAGSVLRAMRPYLREQRYGDALLEAANSLGTRITQARNASPDAPPPQPRQRKSHESPIPLGVIAGGIIIFFLLSALTGGRRRRYAGSGGMGSALPWLILGNMMGGRGWNNRSGGGFGGFDSSGGFGGFGGGDSGGGGASSSW